VPLNEKNLFIENNNKNTINIINIVFTFINIISLAIEDLHIIWYDYKQ